MSWLRYRDRPITEVPKHLIDLVPDEILDKCDDAYQVRLAAKRVIQKEIESHGVPEKTIRVDMGNTKHLTPYTLHENYLKNNSPTEHEWRRLNDLMTECDV